MPNKTEYISAFPDLTADSQLRKRYSQDRLTVRVGLIRIISTILLVSVLAMAGGCSPIGPTAIKRDRLHYANAVSESWKEQLLLNIVKSRYGDAPAFLEVTSVVSGYTLETEIGAGIEWHPNDPEDFFTMGGSTKYIDRPTLSYTPMSGEKFARSLMAPVPLDALLFVMQQRVPADFILGLTLESLEGYYNAIIYSVGLTRKGSQPADPSFIRVLKLFTELQQARVVSTEAIRKDKRTDINLSFDAHRAAQQDLKIQLAELKVLLDIPEQASQVSVVFGSRARERDTIALRTRSLLEIITTLGGGVQVQQEHLQNGSALDTGSAPVTAGFKVFSDIDQPPDPFVAVPYEGLWFWIDRRDYATKSTLTALTVIFNLLEGGGNAVSPVLTIPIQ
jgi:hypothetical protein